MTQNIEKLFIFMSRPIENIFLFLAAKSQNKISCVNQIENFQHM
jgi:hypothetical protein